MDASTFSVPSVVGFVARWLIFTGVVIPFGAVVFRLAVVGRAAVSPDEAKRLADRAALFGGRAALLVVPGALARLYFQVALMRFPDEPWLPFALKLLTASSWGFLWFLQLGLALVASFLIWRSAWRPAALIALGLAVTPSFSSHAMSAHPGPALTLPADMLHLVGAATWLGTLATMFVAARRASSPRLIAALLGRFSPLALLGAATVVASGVVASYAHLESPMDLVRSPYGRLLVAKVAVVVAVGAFGWRNWRRMTPRVSDGETSALFRSIAVELAAAILLLAVTSALVITPPPGHG